MPNRFAAHSIAALPWRWYALSLVVIMLDLATKAWVESTIAYGVRIEITSFFNLTLRYNTGAAFSFLADAGGWQRWFFTVLATGVSAVLITWLARLEKSNWLESLALALILGGALGNLYDRVSLGHVVDFIEVHYQDYYFPAFNVADSAITVGAVLLILDVFKKGRAQNND